MNRESSTHERLVILSASFLTLSSLVMFSRICHGGCNPAGYFLDGVRIETQLTYHGGDSRIHTSRESVTHSANGRTIRTKNVIIFANDTRPMSLCAEN